MEKTNDSGEQSSEKVASKKLSHLEQKMIRRHRRMLLRLTCPGRFKSEDRKTQKYEEEQRAKEEAAKEEQRESRRFLEQYSGSIAAAMIRNQQQKGYHE